MSAALLEGTAALPAAAALERECFPDAWTEAALAQSLNVEVTLLLASPDGAGYILTRMAWGESALLRLAVTGNARRRGLGTQLLQAALDYAKTAGAERMLLEVRASNAPALALYRAAGFDELSRRKNYYAAPREDAVIMECRWSCADIGN